MSAALTVCILAACGTVGGFAWWNSYANGSNPSHALAAGETSLDSSAAPDKEKFKISFTSSYGREHVNPQTAVVSLGTELTSEVTYTIKDSNGNIVFVGEGINARSGITTLEDARHYGSYELEFSVVFENGYAARIHREFDIVSEQELAGLESGQNQQS